MTPHGSSAISGTSRMATRTFFPSWPPSRAWNPTWRPGSRPSRTKPANARPSPTGILTCSPWASRYVHALGRPGDRAGGALLAPAILSVVISGYVRFPDLRLAPRLSGPGLPPLPQGGDRRHQARSGAGTCLGHTHLDHRPAHRFRSAHLMGLAPPGPP